jgi:hypothetical protein
MSHNLKELIVVLVIGGAVLYVATPVMLRFCDARDHRRRCLVWVTLTIAAFLSPTFWWFALIAVPLLYWSGRQDSHPVALYLFMLQVVPSVFVDIPTIGISKLFALDIYRLLSLCVLVPAAWRIHRLTRTGATRHRLAAQDWILLAYGALQMIFYARPDLVVGADASDSATNALRRGFLYLIDSYAVYYAVSRYCTNRRALTEALAALCLCCAVAAPIAVFESARHWLLYGGLSAQWSHDPAANMYLIRDHVLRAQAAAGDPLSLGYLLAIACGLWLYLWRHAGPALRKGAAVGCLWLGLLAAYSRGPWIGAVVIYMTFAVAVPQQKLTLLKTGGVLIVLWLLLMLTPFGPKILDALPFAGGSVDSGNYLYRRRLVAESWQLIQQHPLLGDQFAYSKLGDLRQGGGIIDLVNSYVDVALFYGLIGLSLFTGFMLLGLRNTYRAMRLVAAVDPDLAILGATLVAAIVGTLLMLANCSFILSYSTLYYVLGGFAAAYPRLGLLLDSPQARAWAPEPAPAYAWRAARRG